MLLYLKAQTGRTVVQTEALKALFRAEVARMNEVMDNLVTAARVTGTHTNPANAGGDVHSDPSQHQALRFRSTPPRRGRRPWEAG